MTTMHIYHLLECSRWFRLNINGGTFFSGEYYLIGILGRNIPPSCNHIIQGVIKVALQHDSSPVAVQTRSNFAKVKGQTVPTEIGCGPAESVS